MTHVVKLRMTNEENTTNNNDVVEWVPVATAAQMLGITTRSVYRRAKEGKMQHRTEANGRILVAVSESDVVTETVTESATRDSSVATQAKIEGLQAKIEDLQADKEWLQHRVEFYELRTAAMQNTLDEFSTRLLGPGDQNQAGTVDPKAGHTRSDNESPKTGWRQALADWIAGK